MHATAAAAAAATTTRGVALEDVAVLITSICSHHPLIRLCVSGVRQDWQRGNEIYTQVGY
jgi:hypothetical protein